MAHTQAMFANQAQSGRFRVLFLVCLADTFAMSIWFSFSAVKPIIANEWSISNSSAGLILSALQLGYILAVVGVGYLVDKLNPRKVMAVSALMAACLNFSFGTVASGVLSAIVLRFLVGAAMAGLYTPGIKLLSDWFPAHERGRAIGTFVGALTVGTASPYLLGPVATAYGWRALIYATVVAALLAAAILWLLIPDRSKTEPNRDRSFGLNLLSDRPLTLMNLGYVAHMWELYAMWGWVGPFLVASFQARDLSLDAATAAGGQLAFLIIAMGAPACVAGGVLGDRIGRTLGTSVFLVVSVTCSLSFGFLAGGPIIVLLLVGLLYGFAIVGDSPLYSAGVTELAPNGNVGAALGVQSVLGFSTTIVSTALFGLVIDHLGWAAGFIMLGVGASSGLLAMLWLRRLPQSSGLAAGRK